jgi:hypothetical protein
MKKNTMIITLTVFLLLALATMFIIPSGIAPNILYNNNYNNVTVKTNVTITHSRPQVINVTIYEALNISAKNITISAGSTKKVFCNATVRDWNGFNDINMVNATLYHVATSNPSFADNNNSHYTNVSCVYNDSLASGAPYLGWYVCSFDVYYFSNNGTWGCNVTIGNSYTVNNSNYTGTNNGSTVFYPVYALNITDGIDYGSVAVEDWTNPDIIANITNLGNMGINITLEGYGTKKGDGLAMNCSIAGNISVENERYSLLPGTIFDNKVNLSSSSKTIANLTMPKQTISGTYVTNSTYWELFVPPNPAGNCSGFILFTAIAP